MSTGRFTGRVVCGNPSIDLGGLATSVVSEAPTHRCNL